MKTLFFILLTSLTSQICGQPTIKWQKSFGGSEFEFPGSLILNRNGGFTIAGSSNSQDGQVNGLHVGSCSFGICQDYWVVNTDSLGNLLWEKCFGGTGDDAAYSIASTGDGGSIICGYTTSLDGDVTGIHTGFSAMDVWVVRLDSSGNLLWQRCLGGSRGEFGFSIISTIDKGFVIAAYANSYDGDVPGNNNPNQSSDVWVIKLDSFGSTVWSQIYGGPGDDWPSSIIQTYDSGYAFLGWSAGAGGQVTGYHSARDYWLGKIDKSGVFQWGRCYGGSDFDEGYDIKQTPDSGFILTGRTLSHDGDVTANLDTSAFESWTIKTDKNGNIEWVKTLGGTAYDQGASILILSDSSFLLSCTSQSNDRDVSGNNGGDDIFLAILNFNGQVLWNRCFGGPGQENARSMIEIGNKDLCMVAESSYNGGDVSGNHGYGDYWLVRLNEASTSVPNNSPIQPLEIFPNPFDNSISIKFKGSMEGNLKVLDMIGNIVFEIDDFNSRSINLSFLSTGIYFVNFTNKSGFSSQKIVKIN
ncbi:MAG TPA: T9SS type A sorting domain-containing protein [Bacteroidia bacterium]|nr:T9SS type A sorting domain-containing protein [Bacteroidia bacterium]